MSKAFLLMMLILPCCAWAEGDESSYAATPADEAAMNSEAPPGEGDVAGYDAPSVVEEKVTEPILPGEVKSTSLTTPPPASQSDQKMLSAQIQELTAELRSVKQELNQLKKPSSSPAATPASASVTSSAVSAGASPAASTPVADKVSDDPIGNLLPGQDNDGAKTPEERAATEKARETAGPGTLSVDSVHDQYNQLCGLYNETMLAEGDAFKGKVTQFKSACARFIEQHKDHSFSRSAIFYLGSVMLKNAEYTEAQQAFATAYKGDEKGPHAADALLGIAEINAKNGKKDFAVTFLGKVKKDFDPHYLTEDTREKFKHVAKLANSPLTLGKASKPTVVVAKGPVKGVKNGGDTPKTKAATEVKKPVAAPKPAQQIQA